MKHFTDDECDGLDSATQSPSRGLLGAATAFGEDAMDAISALALQTKMAMGPTGSPPPVSAKSMG